MSTSYGICLFGNLEVRAKSTFSILRTCARFLFRAGRPPALPSLFRFCVDETTSFVTMFYRAGSFALLPGSDIG